MIDIYDTIINVMDDNKMFFLKYKIVNDKLYAFNYYNPIEKRKLVEVKKINKIPVETFIKNIKDNDLYNPFVMNKYGIDFNEYLILDLVVDDKIISYDVYDSNTSDDIFLKHFKKNENINENVEINYDYNQSQNNKMLNYASTNVKSLLSILNSMVKTEKDKKCIDSFLQTILSFNNTFTDVSSNLDMLFLSTQLLVIDSKIKHIPDFIKEIMKNSHCIIFSDKDLSINNNAILTNDEVDYEKVIKMIRNCLAHSNYRVLQNGIIEFYNEGKQKIHFSINKKDIKLLFKELYNFYYYNGIFPIAFSDYIITTPDPFKKDELIKYLKSIEIGTLSNPELKTLDDNKEQAILEGSLRESLEDFKKCTIDSLYAINTKEKINNYFKSFLSKLFNDDCHMNFNKMTDEDIEYILSNIVSMGEDHFYELGSTSQLKIIHYLIKKRYNNKYQLLTDIEDISHYKYDNNNSLIKEASDYIKAKTKIELLITAILNNVLLFCYNQNKATINSSNIRFPEQLYKSLLDSQIKEFYNASKDSADYEYMYNTFLKVSSSQIVKESDYRMVENEISKFKNKLIKLKKDIEYLNNIINDEANQDEYNIINIEILNRIRNCLAHGNLNVDCIDIKQIINSNIQIKDEYEDDVKFFATVSFGEIINSINDDVFMKSLVDDNQNFSRHSYNI